MLAEGVEEVLALCGQGRRALEDVCGNVLDATAALDCRPAIEFGDRQQRCWEEPGQDRNSDGVADGVLVLYLWLLCSGAPEVFHVSSGSSVKVRGMPRHCSASSAEMMQR